MKLWVEVETGVDEEQDIPCVFDVCPRCEGHGVHDHPAFSNGLTAEDFADDVDGEFRESYMRGAYDVACSECNGLRVVEVPDEERMTPAQREAWDSHCEGLAEDRAWRKACESGHGW